MAGADRCVCCGKIVPEGRQVCPSCQKKLKWERKHRRSKEYAAGGYLNIKAYTPYVDGIVGADIKLTFKQKIKILFCNGVSVYLGNVFKKDGAEDGN